MAYALNDKIKNLVPYEPISGTYEIRLDANECPENYPPEILSQVQRVVSETAFNRYPDPMASGLIQAFSDFYGVDPSLVTAGNGADELIFLIETAFLKKGDRLLVALPDFSMYQFYSSICEVSCISLEKQADLTIQADQILEAARKNQVQMIIFSNPCNPTGQGMKAEDVRRLIKSTDALVVLDEAYMDFWDQSLLSEAHTYDNLIILRTASKVAGSAALRLGFAVANRRITDALRGVKSPYNVNSISQEIGRVLYQNKEYLRKRQKKIVTAREKLYNDLLEIGKTVSGFYVYPSVANFVFVKTPDAKALFDYLKTKSVVIRYMGDYVRITAGTPAENETVCRYIRNYFAGK